MNAQSLGALEQVLWPNGGRRDVWMIVDAARDRRIFGMLLDGFYSDHSCLFAGPLVPELEVAAPYLVRLEYQGAKTRRFITDAWGKHWGVLLRTTMSEGALLSHLRDLVTVRGPGGQTLLFRYYDPRVLRAFLPTCSEDQLQTVFGGIECFWMEDAKPGVLMNTALDRKALVVRSVPLSAQVI
jgi:hypothetical protein